VLAENSINDLIEFIKSRQYGLCRSTGNGYYQSFCPDCGDHERKPNPDHGHLNVMFKELMCKCWRCDKSSSLLQFLLKLGYNNQEIIKELKRSGYTYGNTKENTKTEHNTNLKDILRNKYLEFQRRNPIEFNRYLEYIRYRCGDINPIKYGFSPLINKDQSLLIEFYNSSGYPITARFIDNISNIRYIKYKNSGYYYFQNIRDIIEQREITISEGIFDIVNLSNYYLDFKDSFFFAMNNRRYTSVLHYLLQKYFLVGVYNFNIIFDSDVINIDKTKRSLVEIKQKFNSECKLKFYQPRYSKDVSELMMLRRI